MLKKYLMLASCALISAPSFSVDLSPLIIDAHNAETLLVSAAYDIEAWAQSHGYIIKDVLTVLARISRLVGRLPLKIGPINLPGSKQLKNANTDMIRVIAALQTMKTTFDGIEAEPLIAKIKEVIITEITQDIVTELNKTATTPLTEEQIGHITNAVATAIPALLDTLNQFLKITKA